MGQINTFMGILTGRIAAWLSDKTDSGYYFLPIIFVLARGIGSILFRYWL